ncbi:hypothetical protein ACFW81_24095 [Streptomyces angustmyceticus]|uniref:hypothetical protein n=1 Tax=Streptomyces angustmyceticus TaxID=285578 RepID=UPI00367CBD9D
MTTSETNPQAAIDMDGCSRFCRLSGSHTKARGCAYAPEPEATVSISRVYTAADGYPAIGFDTYTVQEFAALIQAVLHEESSGDSAALAKAAAHAVFNRNDSQAGGSR